MGKKGGKKKTADPGPAPEREEERVDGDGDADDGDDGAPDQQEAKPLETMSQLRARHVREMKDHKKAMDKLGKKQKEEVQLRTKEIEERHAAELAELRQAHAEAEEEEGDEPGPAASENAAEDAAKPEADAIAGLSLYGNSEQKLSKSQRKKQQKLKEEAEREARIKAEKAAMGPTSRDLEENALLGILLPLKLAVREVPADGNCMYRALEDQLVQAPDGGPVDGGFQGLRRMAAEHIRAHADDYIPFIVEGAEDDDAIAAQFESYCHEIENTATWGGQIELRALATALGRHIAVYSTDMGRIDMGEEHKGGKTSLSVCYLRHAYGMGEHYNSTVPMAS